MPYTMNRNSKVPIIHFEVWDRGQKTIKHLGIFGNKYVKMENIEFLFTIYQATYILKNKV